MSINRYVRNRWITNGNFENFIVVMCPRCQWETPLRCALEFGAAIWSVENCLRCKREFTGEEDWYEDLNPPDIEI